MQYVFLGFLQGGGAGGAGLLSNARQYVWIRVTQYTSKMMKVKLFAHLHGYEGQPSLLTCTGMKVKLFAHLHRYVPPGLWARVLGEGVPFCPSYLLGIIFEFRSV